MGLPRAYLVCLLFVRHSFAETGPGGSAAQLAGDWEVFSPGPLTPKVKVLAQDAHLQPRSTLPRCENS